MTEISFRVIALATAMTATVACSSDDSSTGKSAADSGGPAADSGAADAPQLSPDCKRLYDCCVGPAAQSMQFCAGLVAGGACDVWLQSYAQAGIQCN